LPVDPVVLASLRETGWNLEDPVNRILAYPHTPFCTLIDGSLLKAPLTGREQRKKTMGAEEIGGVSGTTAAARSNSEES
jgi:hypothetical protein